jgi:hypothetical protein
MQYKFTEITEQKTCAVEIKHFWQKSKVRKITTVIKIPIRLRYSTLYNCVYEFSIHF